MRAGLPHDPAQWIAAALGVAAMIAAPFFARPARRRALFVAGAAAFAAIVSAIYIVVYLRGGPRIIDATSYWLSARVLSEGSMTFPLHEPVSATLGRFLVRSDAIDGPRAAVIFPPGYPALLALGFLVGAPLAVGPLLAAAIVVTTYDLGEQVAASLGAPSLRTENSGFSVRTTIGRGSIGQIAASLSVVCGALRYHTADTMSHGLAALCFSASLTLALRARIALGSPHSASGASRRRATALALASGLFAGWLAATRPVTSIALALTLGAILVSERGSSMAERGAALAERARLAAAIAIGALPGLVLLVVHQRAATGSFAASSQALYYANSDGPPGCFRYGFGATIGCAGEHGDFVSKYMPKGYGAIDAALTTLRRLKMHLVDAANAEPLALLVPAGAIAGWSSPRVRVLAAGVALVIAAYIPFYFDGNYPGGGARFFADVLPLEHVLLAVAAVAIARRIRPARPELAGVVVGLSLFGFAVRAGFDHAALRDREGGRPMFEPAILAEAGVTSGLVFVDTDHGFNLAFDPARDRASAPSTGAEAGVQIARFHGDAIDRMTWEAAGRPRAYRYSFDILESGIPAFPSIEPLREGLFHSEGLAPLEARPLIEGESLWPARSQREAYALPEYASGTCASGSQILSVHSAPRSSAAPAQGSSARGPDDGPSGVVLSLPSPWLRGVAIAPTVAVTEGAEGSITLILDGADAHTWSISAAALAATPGITDNIVDLTCYTLDRAPIPPSTREVSLRIARSGSDLTAASDVLGLDRIDWIPLGSP